MGFGFEGHNELILHSRAWAEGKWKVAQPWVSPSSRVLRAGEEAMYGLRLVLALGPTKVWEGISGCRSRFGHCFIDWDHC